MNDWLVRNVGLVLVVAGIAMVLLAAFLVDDSAVAVALVVMGAGAVILGAVVNRAEGPIELGPSGLKLVVAKVTEKAEKQGLDKASRDRAIALAVEQVARRSPGTSPDRPILDSPTYPNRPAGGRVSSRQRLWIDRYADELVRSHAKGLPPSPPSRGGRISRGLRPSPSFDFSTLLQIAAGLVGAAATIYWILTRSS